MKNGLFWHYYVITLVCQGISVSIAQKYQSIDRFIYGKILMLCWDDTRNLGHVRNKDNRYQKNVRTRI